MIRTNIRIYTKQTFLFMNHKVIDWYGGVDLKRHLQKLETKDKERWKHKLLNWGGALHLCEKKQEELHRLIALKNENEMLLKAYGKNEALQGIAQCFEKEIARIEGEIVEILNDKHFIDQCVLWFPLEEKEFLELRFIKGYSYDNITIKTHLSRSSCFRLQDRILEKLAKTV